MLNYQRVIIPATPSNLSSNPTFSISPGGRKFSNWHLQAVKNASHSGPGIGHEAGKATYDATRILEWWRRMVKTQDGMCWTSTEISSPAGNMFFLPEICMSNKMMNDLWEFTWIYNIKTNNWMMLKGFALIVDFHQKWGGYPWISQSHHYCSSCPYWKMHISGFTGKNGIICPNGNYLMVIVFIMSILREKWFIPSGKLT